MTITCGQCGLGIADDGPGLTIMRPRACPECGADVCSTCSVLGSHSLACPRGPYALVRRSDIEAAVTRAIRAAYSLGARDAQRICAGITDDEHDAKCDQHVSREWVKLHEERALTAARIGDEIRAADVTRAEPDWTGMVRTALGIETRTP